MSIDLEAIKARAAAASPGPWPRTGPIHAENCSKDCALRRMEGVHSPSCPVLIQCQNDGAFINHARSDIPALIARVEELEKVRESALEYAIKLRAALKGASK